MSSQSTASARPGSEAIDREAYEKLGYRLAWSGFASFDTTSGGRTKFVEPMGDALAIQDSAASITLLSASSGEQLWATAIADPLTKFLGLARRNGRVLAVTETEVFALDVDSGAIISRSRLDRVAASGPVQVGNAILLGTISRVAFAQLTDRNASAWAFTLTGPSTIDPALFETFAIAYPTDDGNVTVLDPASGALRGSTRMFGPAGGAVAAGDLAFFVPSLDQSLYAVDARNGQTRWRLRTESPLNRPAVFAGGAVYTVVGPRGLACIEPGTGKVRWAQEKVTGDAVATAKGRVIAFDARSGKAWSVDPADGSVVAEITLANVAVLKATRVDEGELYAVSATGEVSKFSPH
jgi:outer membrane protein assembly factor BamB